MRDFEQVLQGKPEKQPLKRGPVKMEKIKEISHRDHREHRGFKLNWPQIRRR